MTLWGVKTNPTWSPFLLCKPLFNHARVVYVSVMFVTFLISIVDGFKALCGSLGIEYYSWLQPIVSFYENVLPFYNVGLGWLIPFIIVTLVTGIIAKFEKTEVKSV